MFVFTEAAIQSQLPDIRVFGVGGAGCHIVEKVISEDHPFQFFMVDSSYSETSAEFINLGDSNNTRGLGAGSDIEVGRASALTSINKLKDGIKGTEMVMLIAGLGGGIGSGTIPVIVEAANEMSIPVMTFLIEPFPFERGRRTKNCERCLQELEALDTALVLFSNSQLLTVLGGDTRFVDAMAKSSELVSRMITRLLSLFASAGLINIDFSDLRTFLQGGGKMFFGESIPGSGIAMESAVLQALDNPFISKSPIKLSEANQILAYLEVGKDFNLGELYSFGQHIEALSSLDALVIIGITVVSEWQSELRVTVMAKGFEAPQEAELPLSDIVRFVRRR